MKTRTNKAPTVTTFKDRRIQEKLAGDPELRAYVEAYRRALARQQELTSLAVNNLRSRTLIIMRALEVLKDEERQHVDIDAAILILEGK